MDTERIDKKLRAKRKLDDLKGFYWHLASYLLVNTMLTVFKIAGNLSNGESFGEAFFDFGTFAVWMFWGIGLAFHAAKVFSYNPFFSKEWEKRQIQKFMEEDRKEAEKFK